MNLQNSRAHPLLHKDDSHGASPATDERELLAIARSGSCVLLTGRRNLAEAVAFRIHNLSEWRYGPFTVLDCGWPEEAVAAALFERAAPPSARTVERRVRPRAGGTLLLKEVGRLSVAFQFRLADSLLAIRDRGSSRRLIASTSEPLLPRVDAGTFDHRLYYRLNIVHVML